MAASMLSAPPRSSFTSGGSWPTPWTSQNPRSNVEKFRIGGGFGAKQTVVAEVYPALVTWKTGRPAKMIYTRQECQTAGTPRHEMEVRVRLGASNDGTIRAWTVYTLSNTGATESTAPPRWACRATSPFPCTPTAWRHSASPMMWFTPTTSPPGPTGATAPPRASMRWRPPSTRLAETLGMDPTAIRDKTWCARGCGCPPVQ